MWFLRHDLEGLRASPYFHPWSVLILLTNGEKEDFCPSFLLERCWIIPSQSIFEWDVHTYVCMYIIEVNLVQQSCMQDTFHDGYEAYDSDRPESRALVIWRSDQWSETGTYSSSKGVELLPSLSLPVFAVWYPKFHDSYTPYLTKVS